MSKTMGFILAEIEMITGEDITHLYWNGEVHETADIPLEVLDTPQRGFSAWTKSYVAFSIGGDNQFATRNFGYADRNPPTTEQTLARKSRELELAQTVVERNNQ